MSSLVARPSIATARSANSRPSRSASGALAAPSTTSGIDPGGVYLRLERRNNRLLGYTSKDGKNWTKLEPMEPSYPATLKVGLYAINGCTDPDQRPLRELQFHPGEVPPARRRPSGGEVRNGRLDETVSVERRVGPGLPAVC